MTAATLTASGITPISLGQSERGLSPAATDLATRMKGVFAQFREPLSLGGGYQSALAELEEVASEAGIRDWDGHGAIPVSAMAVEHTIRLLSALPTNIPAPEIAADPDGEISLDWYRSPDWVVSISVGARGELSFAARFGRSRVRGIEEGMNGLPAPVLGQIERFLTGATPR
jgi:hypothetical protein